MWTQAKKAIDAMIAHAGTRRRTRYHRLANSQKKKAIERIFRAEISAELRLNPEDYRHRSLLDRAWSQIEEVADCELAIRAAQQAEEKKS